MKVLKTLCAFALLSLPALAGAAAAAAAKTEVFEAGTLRVERVSDRGPPVILIPGLSSGPWVWESTVRRLAPRYSVYLLTVPGFDGRAPVEGATLDTLAADIATLIGTRKLKKPVLVGHSLGGTLSLVFATTRSELIRGVVAVDGLPVFPGTEGLQGGDRAAMAARTSAQFAAQTPEQYAAGQRAYMTRMGVLDEALATKLAEHTARSDAHASAAFMGQLLELDLRPKLAGITVPVVEISPFNAPDFAAMGADENGKTNYYRGLLAGIGKLDVVSISPARHFVMFDQPEKFGEALDAALASMLAASAK